MTLSIGDQQDSTTHTLASTLPPVPPSFMVDVCRTEGIAERQGGVLLQVHLADDLVLLVQRKASPLLSLVSL